MQVKPWKREPDAYQMMCVFKGDHQALQSFFHIWLTWEGRLTPIGLPVVSNKQAVANQTAYEGYAIFFPNTPPYYLVQWWIDQKEWTVYYQEKRDSALGVSYITQTPEGNYCIWQYHLDKPITKSKDKGANKLQLIGLNNEILLAAKKTTFQPVLNDWRFFVPEMLHHAQKEGKDVETGLFDKQLPIRPVKILFENKHSDPESQIIKLQEEINLLEKQKRTLEWWHNARYIPFLEMYVYQEEVRNIQGSFWRLRDWMIASSAEEQAQFLHSRIQISTEDGKRTQIFHLVVPKIENLAPKVNLPTPTWKLVRSRQWYANSRRELFMEEGYELTPPPPLENDYIVGQMAEEIWGKEGHEEIQLLMFRVKITGENTWIRIPVSLKAFQSIEKHTEDFNFQLIGEVKKPELIEEIDLIKEILDNSHDAYAESLYQETEKIGKMIRKIEKSAISEMRRAESRINQLFKLVQEIEEHQNKVADLRKQAFTNWNQVYKEVAALQSKLQQWKRRN